MFYSYSNDLTFQDLWITGELLAPMKCLICAVFESMCDKNTVSCNAIFDEKSMRYYMFQLMFGQERSQCRSPSLSCYKRSSNLLAVFFI